VPRARAPSAGPRASALRSAPGGQGPRRRGDTAVSGAEVTAAAQPGGRGHLGRGGGRAG
jgi:hypothetical protein